MGIDGSGCGGNVGGQGDVGGKGDGGGAALVDEGNRGILYILACPYARLMHNKVALY